MEGFGKAIVSGLFVVLVVMAIVILGLSFLSPLENRKKIVKYSNSNETSSQPAPQQEPEKTSFNPLNIFGLGGNKNEPVATSSPENNPGSQKPAQTPVSPPPAPTASPTSIGTSPVVDGIVVQTNMKPVDTSADSGSATAPLVSRPITRDQYLKNSFVIEVSDQGMNPDNFTVKSGMVVNLAVHSQGDFSHVFRFKDKSLNAVAIGIGPDESREITFNAPGPGKYDFFCDIPGHKTREVGTMTVN